jgi:hypothetical protein
MSILIKGMEMPKTCRKCGFYHHSVDDGYYDFEYCGANNAEFNNAYDSTKPHINPFEEKLSTCPLVPVPPHGDLIDRREAERYALPRTEMVDGEIVQNKYVYLQTIQQLPTIIPAEEGET